MAAGLQQAFRADAMSKPLHSGRAAEAGVLAARLAKAGVTGALDALEGPRGFGAAMSGPDVDWEAATATLGTDWTITRVTFKNHAACGHVHAAVDAAAEIAATKAAGGRVIPVGTTALRLIETAARETGTIAPWQGVTDIFIYPGFAFRVTDALMTNFHLPKSTLMMLVSALMGRERMMRVYAHAIAERYRFFSYGDASLLIP